MALEEVALPIDQELERLDAGERNAVVTGDLRHNGLEPSSTSSTASGATSAQSRASGRAVDVVCLVADPDGGGSRRRCLHRGAEASRGLRIEESSADEEAERSEEVGIRHRGSNAIVEAGQ